MVMEMVLSDHELQGLRTKTDGTEPNGTGWSHEGALAEHGTKTLLVSRRTFHVSVL